MSCDVIMCKYLDDEVSCDKSSVSSLFPFSPISTMFWPQSVTYRLYQLWASILAVGHSIQQEESLIGMQNVNSWPLEYTG